MDILSFLGVCGSLGLSQKECFEWTVPWHIWSSRDACLWSPLRLSPPGGELALQPAGGREKGGEGEKEGEMRRVLLPRTAVFSVKHGGEHLARCLLENPKGFCWGVGPGQSVQVKC